MFDVITRHLRRHFPQVEYVRNITDIDDKIIQRAVEKILFADKYTRIL
jgi:cysteinyl-tRNA synthetase